MSDNKFPDPISAWNSPSIITLPHQPTHYHPTPVVPTISLRDYFAAAALKGILANPEANRTWNETDVAKFCFGQADAMLKAREVKL
jgi:hypothetical protein